MTSVLPTSVLPKFLPFPDAGTVTLLAGWDGFADGEATPAQTGTYAGRAMLTHGDCPADRVSKGLVTHHPFPGSRCPQVDLTSIGLTSGSFLVAMSVDHIGADWQPTGHVAQLLTVESDGFFLYRHLFGVGVADMTDLCASFLGTQYAGSNDGAFYRATVDLIRPLHLVVCYEEASCALALYTSPTALGSSPPEHWKKLSLIGARTLDLRFDGADFRYVGLTLGGWHDGSNPLSMTLRSLEIYSVTS